MFSLIIKHVLNYLRTKFEFHQTFTRDKRTESLTELNKSAITDLGKKEHIIDWEISSSKKKTENTR